ncbi:MAG: aerobic carbon-monoxide dehydrogenase medium subunit [Thermoleophilales bacterium]|nr:aerobic carbon-monoxide dehydrogenase medium subunit [Thermoleophilales bacterium]
MKPAPFRYHRPSTRSEVDRLLADLGDDAKILAGGQSLVPILNMRLAAPAHLIDINRLAGESGEPVAADGAVVVGPLVRHEALERSPLAADRLPLLRETVQYVAHPAIRSRGTVVGSIAHADPAAELPAAFALLGGEARARSVRGTRAIPAHELFTSQLETSLEPGEWIEEVRFPVDAAIDGYAVEEFARRHGDYAVCGVLASASRVSDGAAIALSFISMGATPLRIELPPIAAGDVGGDALSAAVAAAVRDRLEPEADLHATVEYRTALAERLGARAARRAARMALEES